MAESVSPPTTAPPSTAPHASRGLLILLGIAAAVISVAGLKAVSGLAGPAFLATVLMITVYPIRTWLAARGTPGWLASLAIVLAVYLVLILMVVALVLSVGRLAALVPSYAGPINNLTHDVGHWLSDQGVKQEQINVILGKLDVGKLVSLASTILSGILSVLSNLAFIATLVLFMGFDAGRFPRHLRATRDERPAIVDALTSFVRGTRTYFAVSAGFGLVVAVIDSAALAIMGIPAALVWGVLSFVTNFIPNIGFVIGVIPPAALGLLEGGPGLMIAVIVVYSVINFVVQSVIQPKFVGDALGLSATLTFLSLVFWAFVLGPLGAILALPMTLLVKALLVDVDPGARWLVPLLSGSDADADEPPPQEPEEAEEDADEVSEPTGPPGR